MFKWFILFVFLYLVFKYANYLIGLFSSQGSGSGSGSGTFQNKRNEPRVDVKYNPNKENKNFDDGEYIDFEEVKD